MPSLFLQKIVEEYHKDGGFIGEDRNIAKLFFIAISRHLPKDYRLHATIISQSSAGKSTLVKTVIEPFREDVEYYTRITGPALDRNTESLDGKILFYEQMQGYEPSQLKLMLSEGELSLLVVDTDERGKKNVVRHNLKGMPVFITTSTNPNIDQELLNRTLTITLDESSEQTRAIKMKQAEKFSTVKTVDLGMWSTVSSLEDKLRKIRDVTISQIMVPYAVLLVDQVPNHIEMRRDFNKLLSLASIIAYTKSMSNRGYWERSKIENVSEKIIIAYPEDFEDALWCMGENLAQALYRFVGKAKEIHNLLVKEEVSMTTKEISLSLGIDQKTAYKYSQYLVQINLATMEKEGNKNLYQAILGKTVELNPIDLSGFDLQRWVTDNLAEIPYREVEGSSPSGPESRLRGPDIPKSSISSANNHEMTSDEVLPQGPIGEGKKNIEIKDEERTGLESWMQ